MTTAAIISITILSILSVFQLALAAGAPLGKFAWGGQHKKLPTKLRLGSLLAIVIYIGISVCLLSKSGLYQIIPQGIFLNIIIWVIFAYLIFGSLMNVLSKSKSERYFMTPITLILAYCSFIIAAG